HMPGASGYEVCRRAKELHPGVPVLLLVGTFEPFDEGKAREVGADSFLKKPFDSQELLQTVDRLLGPRPNREPIPPAVQPEAEPEPEPEPAWSNLALEADEPAATEVLPPHDRYLEEEPEEEVAAPAVASYPWREQPTTPMPVPPAEGRPVGFAPLDEPTLEERAGSPQPESAWAAAATEQVEGAAEAAPATPTARVPDIGEPFPLGRLSDEDVERIARRVAELLNERVLRDVAWEVIPDMAEVVIKERLRELESEVE
ncbi:MAG: response regulator transcription factor, partial [Thermoanaerobaculia bacterium]